MALKVALAATCAAGAALLAVFFWPSTANVARAERELSARTAFEPAAAAFGDTVAARLSVVIDKRVLDPSTLHVTFPLAPLDTVGPTVRRRVDRGDTTVITYTAPVACLGERCVAAGASTTVSPRAPSVEIERRSEGTARASAPRAALTVDRRVGAAAVAAARPPFRGDLGAPRPSYRSSPEAATTILAALAAVLAALGVGTVAAAFLGARGAARSSRVGDLERALALVRSAERRSDEDRRRAVGLLARLLARRDRALAATGDDLAWSRPPPSGTSATRFADDVERTVAP